MWFDTGDVATIDENGYMAVTDRSKDVIKSGGEWISSIDLENAAVAHEDVAEAAAVGVAHEKWGERPILVVVVKPGASPDKKSILAQVAAKVAKWQVPDDVLFWEEIPHTATGKNLQADGSREVGGRGVSAVIKISQGSGLNAGQVLPVWQQFPQWASEPTSRVRPARAATDPPPEGRT